MTHPANEQPKLDLEAARKKIAYYVQRGADDLGVGEVEWLLVSAAGCPRATGLKVLASTPKAGDEGAVGHDWQKSPYGHGDAACARCGITNREAAVLGELDRCSTLTAGASNAEDRGVQ